MSSSPRSDVPPPTARDVDAAADRIAGRAVRTPLLESAILNRRLDARVLVKAEPLQFTGSFKFRGAYNRLCQLSEPQRQAGVVAYSSGNHAQGVAAAAGILGIPATIVMPADAPAIKLDNTRGYGAEVVTYERSAEDRAAIARDIAARRNAVLVPPFDDPDIIAGQGTAGREMARQAAERGAELDMMVCPVGGGGLIAGCSIALKAANERVEIYGVEPEAFDDTRRSLARGDRVAVTASAGSICDALLAPMPGEMTFAINRTTLSGVLTVSDDEAMAAMAVAFRDLKLVVEAGGAVALAAVLSRKIDVAGRSVGVICSGGNVDPVLFAEALSRS